MNNHLHPLLRTTLLLLFFLSAEVSFSQSFSFDVRNADSGDNYRVVVNTSSKRIDINRGSQSVFSTTYTKAQVLTGGIAFAFRQGQTPSLKPDLNNWYFCVKPTTIGFNNPNIRNSFAKADPTNSSSYTSTYNSLVAAINGTGNNNNVSNNNVSYNQSSGSNRTFTARGVSFTMVYVPGGTFTMGASDEQGSDAYDSEKPTHSVTLSSFSIGQTEVTQELWQAVMGSNPSYFKGSKRPVETVSWDDCQTFITKLNSLTGQRFRLPTEAEWEYAARGGKSGGTKYAGSNSIDNVAWYTVNCYDKGSNHPDYGTHNVGTKSPNGLGIYDMSGNVWEWCQDWYGSYSSGSQTNPQGPSTGSDRVNRGGGWNNDARYCRVSFRGSDSPDNRLSNLGLRLAL